MAGANVGNLNVKLTLSAEQFAAALMAAGGDVNAFAMKVESTKVSVRSVSPVMSAATASTSRFGGGMKALSGIMSGASYGAADFASQLSTRGLGGGLQAAANNIQVMGAAFGPWGLAASSAIGLVVQGVGAYIESTERAKKNTKQLAAESTAAMASIAVAANNFSINSTRMQAVAMRNFDKEMVLPTLSTKQLEARRTDALREGDTLAAERAAKTAQATEIINPAFKRLFGPVATPEFLGVTGAAGVDFGQLRGMMGEFPLLKEALGPERIKELNRIEQELRQTAEKAAQNMKDLKATEQAFGPAAQRENQADTEKTIAELQAERDREQSAFNESLKVKGGSQSAMAPTIGATEAGSAGQFSQIQAAMRAGQDRDLAAQKQIQSNTGKTATNTREIARKVGRIKAVSIA